MKNREQEQIETVIKILMTSESAVPLDTFQKALNGVTAQKAARIIAKAEEFMPIIRSKNHKGLTVYKSYNTHLKQGYDSSCKGGWISSRFAHLED